MKKNEVLKIINPVIALLILGQAVTSLLHDFFPGELYEIIHGGGGVLLVTGVVLHLYLNWSWVQATYLKKRVE